MNARSLVLIASILAVGAPAAAQVANPTPAQTEAARARKACGDPWVTIALESVFARVPAASFCDVRLYNNGRWGSYDELLRAVRARYAMRAVRIDGSGPLAGKVALGIFENKQLIGAGGSALVAAGGGNLVAAGGGNLVAAGGGNIINQVGQMLVSPGGGSYTLQSGTPVRVF